MTEADLIEHLQTQLDTARAERLDLYGLALGLLTIVDLVAGLAPDEAMAGMEWYQAVRCRKVLDRAVGLLGVDDADGSLVAGVDVAALADRLAASEPERGSVR